MINNLTFWLEADDPTSTHWKVSICQVSDTDIRVGFHWRDKPVPTHTFTMKVHELAAIAGIMVDKSKEG